MRINTPQKAFVLHTRAYKENQKLVDLFTECDGKVSALVFVGQSKRSIKKGVLQPFLPVEVTLKDFGKIKTISQIEPRGKSFSLVKHSLYSAFYVNELLIRLLSDQIVCQKLFNQYQFTIDALAQGKAIAQELRYFELALLEELGLSFDFSPVFEQTANYFNYQAEQGFLPVYDTNRKNNPSVCFNAVHLKAIAQHIFDASQLALTETAEIEITFKLLMRHVINQLLGNKPLNSRRLFVQR